MPDAPAIPVFSPDLPELTPPRDAGPLAPDRIAGLDCDPRTARRIRQRRLKRIARVDNAKAQLGRLPGLDEQVLLILTGNFHGFDLFTAILDLAGEDNPAREVWIATLGFNRTQTDTLAELLDAGRIKKLTFVVSEMFRDKNPGEFIYLNTVLQGRGHTVAATRNHAKLGLFRFKDGRHIVTHGSLNLRRCNSFEQVAIEQSPKLFRFFRDRYLKPTLAGGLVA